MRRVRHLCCLGLAAIVPLEYYSEDSDSSLVRFGLGAGNGEYASILKSCSDIEGVGKGDFEDVASDVSIRPEISFPLVLGVRGGQLNTDLNTVWTFAPDEPSHAAYRNGYVNPYISFESEYVGIGVGWLRNLGPLVRHQRYDNNSDWRRSRDYLSGHIRIGFDDRVYAMVSFFEGVPIASQYGYLFLGAGGSIRKLFCAAGYSGGFYDGAGIYIGVGYDLHMYGRPMLSVRRGSSHGEFEGSVSLSWSWPIY